MTYSLLGSSSPIRGLDALPVTRKILTTNRSGENFLNCIIVRMENTGNDVDRLELLQRQHQFSNGE